MGIYYFLYSVITGAGIVLLSPYFFLKDRLRGAQSKRYLENVPERLGWRFPQGVAAKNGQTDSSSGASSGTIWVHAVSVGEALTAAPLARMLKQRFPERRLVVSTTTATGQSLARERMAFADAIFYFPLDWRGPVRRALGAVRPKLVIVMETEIWPNFLREARRTGVPVLFVNGRISDRSFRRTARALRWSGGLLRPFLRNVLRDGALYLTQSAADAQRLIEWGAPAERVIVAGNMKYDLAAPGTNALGSWLAQEMRKLRRGPLLVAGSVIAGEEIPVLEALDAVEQNWPNALLLLAPRKPERFEAAAAIVEKSGRVAVRRSELVLETREEKAGSGGRAAASEAGLGKARSVLLLDSIGELAALYRLADAVFVGGSLQPAGGHNPLEPAAAGKPPIFGPAMDNFREIATRLLAADAAVQVRSGTELGAIWNTLLGDANRSARMGRTAEELVEQHRGATDLALEWAAKLLTQTREPAEVRAKA